MSYPRLCRISEIESGPETIEISDSPPVVVVGRSQAQATVVFDSQVRPQTIGRKHATLSLNTASKAIVFTDLGSLNGSYVNGKRVEAPRLLHDGDKLRFGPRAREFVYEVRGTGEFFESIEASLKRRASELVEEERQRKRNKILEGDSLESTPVSTAGDGVVDVPCDSNDGVQDGSSELTGEGATVELAHDNDDEPLLRETESTPVTSTTTTTTTKGGADSHNVDDEEDDDEAEQEMTCLICQDLFVRTVSLPCGHQFCRGCITQWLAWKSGDARECVTCRATVPENWSMTPCVTLDNLVRRYLKRKDKTRLKEWEEREEKALRVQRQLDELARRVKANSKKLLDVTEADWFEDEKEQFQRATRYYQGEPLVEYARLVGLTHSAISQAKRDVLETMCVNALNKRRSEAADISEAELRSLLLNLIRAT